MSRTTSLALFISAIITLTGATIQSKPVYSSFFSSSEKAANKQQLTTVKPFKNFVRNHLPQKLDTDEGLIGKHTYIIRLKDQSIVSYDGHIPGFSATRLNLKNSNHLQKPSSGKFTKLPKINFSSANVKAYSQYLDAKQASAEREIGAITRGNFETIAKFKNAINGMAVKLTPEEAKKVSELDNVAFVELERRFYVSTDRGPVLIGSPNIWDGSATGTAALGEGVIIGIIDTGINTDHSSFADIGGDGYDHTNPKTGFIGDCETAFPSLCNDKLIGVRSYPSITDDYSDTAVFGATPPAANGEDYNGHGSHTASTAGGNILKNVDLLDPEAAEEGNGINNSGFKFNQISGVAPHANIIAYQVCSPGNSGDTYTGCGGTAIVSAINDAISDGVDVINFSIGGDTPFNPWSSSQEQAFLSAQDAGIFVATSAGNSGPSPATAFKPSAWYTAVAASTHGRTLDRSFQFDGASYTFATGTGPAISSDISAPVIYAGDVDPTNFEGCKAFTAGDFANSIALVKRNVAGDKDACSFSKKVDNAAAAGAIAVVVFNFDGQGQTLIIMGGQESNTIPSIFISNVDGLEIVSKLSATPGISGTIQAQFVSNIGPFDNMASFSSRGPGTTVQNVMLPQVSAPGVSIYAAFADQQFGHDQSSPATADFAFLQGTSMASPHVAGAAALIKSTQPNWTPDNIRSALMMTATTDMRKEDGSKPADIFDRGSGRIRVDLAVNAGLVMDETRANYLAADPAQGGDVKTLNIPSMGNTECRLTCTWTRTVTATKTATWNTSTTVSTTGFSISAIPASFTLNAGESQVVTITADVTNIAIGSFAFGELVLTPADSSIPTAHMPVFTKPFASSLPLRVDVDARRNSSSQAVRSLEALEITQFTARSFGMNKATNVNLTSAADSDNSSPFDDLTDGVKVNFVTLSSPSKLLLAKTSEPSVNTVDVDLYVGIDANNNGIAESSELLCVSGSPTSDELCEIQDVAPGSYWILSQVWGGSGAATDSYKLTYGFVGNTDAGNLTITGPQTVAQFTPFDIRLQWDAQMQQGDVFLAAFDLGTDAANPGNLGSSVVVLNRGTDDVSVSINDVNPSPGDVVNFTVTVAANSTDEDINYAINATMPAGLTLDEASVVASSGTPVTNATGFSWDVLSVTSGSAATLTYSATIENSALGAQLAQVVSSQPDTAGANLENSSVDFKVKGNITLDSIADTTTIANEALTGITVTYTDADTGANTITVDVVNGTASNISGNTSGSTFDVTPDTDFIGNMVVTVTVTDNANTQDSTSTSFNVDVLTFNNAPNVVINAPTNVTQGINTLVLDGSATTDVEGDPLTYSWVQTSGTTMNISNSDKAVANIAASDLIEGQFTVELRVNDGRDTGVASVNITVDPQVVVTPPPAGGGNSGGGGGSIGWILLLLPLLKLRKK